MIWRQKYSHVRARALGIKGYQARVSFDQNKQFVCNLPQYPGVPQTVLVLKSPTSILDSPKSAIFSGHESVVLAYRRFSG